MDLLDRQLGHDERATRHELDRAREVTPPTLHRSFDVGHRTLYATAVHMIEKSAPGPT